MIAESIRAALVGSRMTVLEKTYSYQEAVLVAARAEGVGIVIVPTASTGVREAYTEPLCRNPSVRCLTVSVSPEGADLFELRLLGTDVGLRNVVEAIQTAIASPARPTRLAS